jgi:hypothetical protein
MILKYNFSILNNIYDKSVILDKNKDKEVLEYQKLLKNTIFKDISNNITIEKIKKLNTNFFQKLYFILKVFAEINEYEYFKNHLNSANHNIEDNINEKRQILSKEIIKINNFFL